MIARYHHACRRPNPSESFTGLLIGFAPTRGRVAAVLVERGFDLGYVSRIFPGYVLEREDTCPYAEKRYQAIGEVLGDLFVVVYTRSGGTCRLITAWEAEPYEREIWNSAMR